MLKGGLLWMMGVPLIVVIVLLVIGVIQAVEGTATLRAANCLSRTGTISASPSSDE